MRQFPLVFSPMEIGIDRLSDDRLGASCAS
jgi:hypothetical protein